MESVIFIGTCFYFIIFSIINQKNNNKYKIINFVDSISHRIVLAECDRIRHLDINTISLRHQYLQEEDWYRKEIESTSNSRYQANLLYELTERLAINLFIEGVEYHADIDKIDNSIDLSSPYAYREPLGQYVIRWRDL